MSQYRAMLDARFYICTFSSFFYQITIRIAKAFLAKPTHMMNIMWHLNLFAKNIASRVTQSWTEA